MRERMNAIRVGALVALFALVGPGCGGDSTNPTTATTSGGSAGAPSTSEGGRGGSSATLGGGGTAANGGAGGIGTGGTGGVGGGTGGLGGSGGLGGHGGQGGTGGTSSASGGGMPCPGSGTGGASASSSSGTGGASASSGSGTGGAAPVHVRIVTANTTTGNDQSYDPGQGIRIFQGLHPDIALVQEFNYGNDSPSAIRGMVDAAFGCSFAYQRETTVGIPNGIVSRYPILAGGTFTDPDVTNRSFVWARIDVPGPHDLWAVSVHLLTTSAGNRQTEAAALVADLQGLVPAGDFLVIGGDFNTKARDEACITTLAAIVDTQAPYPVDNLGNDNTNGPRSHAYDWLLPNPALHGLEVAVTIGAATFPSGLVLDSRVFTPLTDVAPVMVADSDPNPPNNMQHMAVVKDFVLPL